MDYAFTYIGCLLNIEIRNLEIFPARNLENEINIVCMIVCRPCRKQSPSADTTTYLLTSLQKALANQPVSAATEASGGGCEFYRGLGTERARS
ncbi:hypothetical protein AAHA92_31267 [Salvia divinorum]|uniref:Uncharacterized protein n=1 Tax=Salvia divinorum TaxID=28513 RepID=A0ABD1FTL4_SALDI